MRIASRANLICLVCYLCVMAVVVGGLVQARRRAIATLATTRAQLDWEHWRDTAARQARGEGPVRRRVPKSSEPPGLVLLRDHFRTSLVAAGVVTSALFLALMAMVRGVLAGPRFQPSLASDEVNHESQA